jgi:hypothetical protein
MTTIPIDDRASRRALERLDGSFELAMIAAGVAWLALVTTALVIALPLLLAAAAIWGAFLVDIGVRLAIATNRRAYLRDNWIVGVALLVPPLRLLRIARCVTALRAMRAARRVRYPRRLAPLRLA